MNILQLCYKPPYPPVDGGTLAMNSITQGLLAAGHSVHVLSVHSDKHPVRRGNGTASPCGRADSTGVFRACVPTENGERGYWERTHFESVYIDLSIHPIDAAVALLCGESYNVKRFVSKAFDDKLKELLDNNDFDIVHIESIFLAPYLDTVRQHSDAKVVLRTHNVEHRIWRQLADNTRHGLKRWYLKRLAVNLRAYETEMVNRFDGLVCITDDDMEAFRQLGCRKPMVAVPFAVGNGERRTGNGERNRKQGCLRTTPINAEPNSLYHIGSMDWRPNVEGIQWFLDKVWPRLHQELPQVRLHLAGRKMPDEMLNLDIEGVSIAGEVPDAESFIASKQINVVPLLSGSGIRVKIIESMAMGKTVITTALGAKGIKYTDGTDILIANTPEDFLKQVHRCIENPEFSENIGSGAQRLIEQHYTLQATTEKLVGFYLFVKGEECE